LRFAFLYCAGFLRIQSWTALIALPTAKVLAVQFWAACHAAYSYSSMNGLITGELPLQRVPLRNTRYGG